MSRGESHITNRSKDLIFSRNMDFASEYASPEEYENPLVSPIYGSFNGFPPILIIVGGDEILLSDSLDLAEKAHKEGVNVEVQVWNRMFHVFPVFGKSVPEAARAMRYVTHFIDRHMTGS
jgi:acetyl esterase/lipase